MKKRDISTISNVKLCLAGCIKILFAVCLVLLAGCRQPEQKQEDKASTFIRDSTGFGYVCPTCEGVGYVIVRGGIFNKPKSMKKKRCPTCDGFKMKPCCVGPSLAR